MLVVNCLFPEGQVLLPDFAQCLSVKAFLSMCNLPFSTVSKTNAHNMSPSGEFLAVRLSLVLRLVWMEKKQIVRKGKTNESTFLLLQGKFH